MNDSLLLSLVLICERIEDEDKFIKESQIWSLCQKILSRSHKAHLIADRVPAVVSSVTFTHVLKLFTRI